MLRGTARAGQQERDPGRCQAAGTARVATAAAGAGVWRGADEGRERERLTLLTFWMWSDSLLARAHESQRDGDGL